MPELILVLNEEKKIFVPRITGFTIGDHSLLTGRKSTGYIHLTGLNVGTGTVTVYKAGGMTGGEPGPSGPETTIYNVTVHPVDMSDPDVAAGVQKLKEELVLVSEAIEELRTTNIAEEIAKFTLPPPEYNYDSILTEQSIQDMSITEQTSQNTTCKDYFLMDLPNVDSDLLLLKPEFLLQPDQYPATVTDKLRAKTGNYWTPISGSAENALIYFRRQYPGYCPIKLFFTEQPVGPYPSTTELFSRTTEVIVLKPKFWAEQSIFYHDAQFMPDEYRTFINETVPLEQWFTDHTCVVNAFYKQKEINEMAAGSALCYAEIKSHYNNYIEPYEQILKENDQIKEWTLPNVYAFRLMKEEEETTEFENLITLMNGGDIKNTLGNYPDNKYYTKYASYRTSNPSFPELDKWKNIAVPYGDIENNKNIHEMKITFPMYIDISFKTDSNTKFADSLKDDKSTMFLKYIIHKLNTDSEFSNMPTYEYGNKRNRANIIKQIDLTEYIKSIRDFDLPNLPQADPVLLGLSRPEAGNDSADSALELSLASLSLFAGFNRMVAEHFRTFREVLAGKPAYSETIMYKIEKYKGITTTNDDGEEITTLSDPIQSIYLPNSNEVDIHQYIDTQIRYGENNIYYYKIFGYEMVIGNKYKYKKLNIYSNHPEYARVQVEQEPSIQLLETLLFEQAIAVVDNPPVAPDVYMVPFKGVNNRIRHLINNNTGTITTQPVSIEIGELDKYNNYRKLKGLATSSLDEGELGDPIVFKNDDIPKYFEIYRMKTRPERYEDFAGQSVIRIPTKISSEIQVTSRAFDDEIQPNQKYYYMFRSIDVHGNISLPTEVYEVEMIDDEGTIYPIIKAIELKEKNMNATSKAFKRFLKIKPATKQIFFNETGYNGLDTAPTDTSQLSLGLAEEESAWGQRFKVRLTSRQTGKKIDINFQFDYKLKG